VTQSNPLHSLTTGSWFKLICGASYQHLPAIRSLAIAYTLAGVDCIDVAADPAVITAVKEGISVAQSIQKANQLVILQQNYDSHSFSSTPTASLNIQGLVKQAVSPWLMISINDGEDPHFRKAHFDQNQCLDECPQPCVQVCPADAIDLQIGGILTDLCYGCGRCLPICPQSLIGAQTHITSPNVVVPWIKAKSVDALEIHTQVGHFDDFKRVWQDIAPVADNLEILAISCTDAPDVIEYLRSLLSLIEPLPCPIVWQTDGRSMSGDIGKGTTHAAISFAQKVLEAELPGHIQLAGGTNNYTVAKLRQELMLRQANSDSNKSISGVAYGSYARSILNPILSRLEAETMTELQIQPQNIQTNLILQRSTTQPMNQLNLKLEQNQELLAQAVATATKLVSQIKTAKS